MDQYIPINPYIIRLLKKMNKTQGNYIYWLPKDILQVILDILFIIVSNENMINIKMIKSEYRTIRFRSLKLIDDKGDVDIVKIIYYTPDKIIMRSESVLNRIYTYEYEYFYMYELIESYDRYIKNLKKIDMRKILEDVIVQSHKHSFLNVDNTIIVKVPNNNTFKLYVNNTRWSILPVWRKVLSKRRV